MPLQAFNKQLRCRFIVRRKFYAVFVLCRLATVRDRYFHNIAVYILYMFERSFI